MMLIKLDENLTGEITFGLSQLGHGVHTTLEQGLAGHSDGDIWTACQQEKRFLITQDLDFSDLRWFAPGTHHGILLIRLHDASRRNLVERITSIFRMERVESWVGCFVVATDHKIRVRTVGDT